MATYIFSTLLYRSQINKWKCFFNVPFMNNYLWNTWSYGSFLARFGGNGNIRTVIIRLYVCIQQISDSGHTTDSKGTFKYPVDIHISDKASRRELISNNYSLFHRVLNLNVYQSGESFVRINTSKFPEKYIRMIFEIIRFCVKLKNWYTDNK